MLAPAKNSIGDMLAFDDRKEPFELTRVNATRSKELRKSDIHKRALQRLGLAMNWHLYWYLTLSNVLASNA